MNIKQNIVTLDLEGVLLPEIWKQIAKVTNIPKLNLTTQDVEDYDELMCMRIQELATHNIGLQKIQKIIADDIKPFDGAINFFNRLSSLVNVIIISDTFSQFFDSLRPVFNNPVVFCNSLVVENDKIIKHQMRLENGKKHCVQALKKLNFLVASAGDSYNDIQMINNADFGCFFNAPTSISKQHPHLPSFVEYDDLFNFFITSLNIKN